MKLNGVFKAAIACAVFATSLSAVADILRLNYTLNTTTPFKSGGGDVVSPEVTPKSDTEYVPVAYSATLSTGLGNSAVVSGYQGTYSSNLPYRINVTNVVFEDVSGSGYESMPKIIAQDCSGKDGAYSCYLTVELRDDSGLVGGLSPWEAAAEVGIEGRLSVTGVQFVPKTDK